MLDFARENGPSGGEQGVWALVAAAADENLLSARQTAILREWAANQMRERPWRVFDRDLGPISGGLPIEAGFPTAIAHAAGDVAAGRLPD